MRFRCRSAPGAKVPAIDMAAEDGPASGFSPPGSRRLCYRTSTVLRRSVLEVDLDRNRPAFQMPPEQAYYSFVRKAEVNGAMVKLPVAPFMSTSRGSLSEVAELPATPSASRIAWPSP